MENEFMTCGYLLAEGCKDLADVPQYEARPSLSPPAPLPPIIGQLTVPAWMTPSELAAALTQKTFRIIADLMELGVFVAINHQLDFETISKVAREYGFEAKRTAWT